MSCFMPVDLPYFNALVLASATCRPRNWYSILDVPWIVGRCQLLAVSLGRRSGFVGACRAEGWECDTRLHLAGYRLTLEFPPTGGLGGVSPLARPRQAEADRVAQVFRDAAARDTRAVAAASAEPLAALIQLHLDSTLRRNRAPASWPHSFTTGAIASLLSSLAR
jgi:hypothetical protein